MKHINGNPKETRDMKTTTNSHLQGSNHQQAMAGLNELSDMGREMSSLDHDHESATNWLHTMRKNQTYKMQVQGRNRRVIGWINDAHDRLMEIQAKQDALGQRIWKLRQKLSR